MDNPLATAAAGVVVLLFGVALASMSTGEFGVAGATFLSASLLIYLRETYLVES